jgi:hypothetical protein
MTDKALLFGGKRHSQPAHVPSVQTRKKVKQLAAAGLKVETICSIMEFSPGTLSRHYRHEFNTGKGEVVARIASSLVQKALTPGPFQHVCQMFYLKTQGGWRETGPLVEIGKTGDNRIIVYSGALAAHDKTA